MICKFNKKYVNKYYKEESDAALRRQVYYGSRKLIIYIYIYIYISTKICARPQLNVEYSRFAAFKNKTLFILG